MSSSGGPGVKLGILRLGRVAGKVSLKCFQFGFVTFTDLSAILFGKLVEKELVCQQKIDAVIDGVGNVALSDSLPTHLFVDF